MLKLRTLLRRYSSFDPRQNSLFRYFKSVRGKSVAPSRGSDVLVQCVGDAFYFGLFGQIVSSLRERRSIRVEQFILRSLNVAESSIFAFVVARLIKNPVHAYKWKRLYASFCNGVGYRSTSVNPLTDVIDLFKAWKCWRNLDQRKTLVDLVIDGVPVGDLVNDSFIRFKPTPTVDLKDVYLWVCLWQAFRDVRRAREYFLRAKPKLYLTSYSTYIQHGVAARVALQCGVKVFSFGGYQEFSKELSLQDWFHTANPDGLLDKFSESSDQGEKLALAETALSTRLKGGIDKATAYMKSSAYAEYGESVPDVRGALIVFLHDFYDSPYIYRDMVFPDFWEWVCFTIETLTKANKRFFLKPHPNQIQLNDDVLDALKGRYPEISIISSKITNTQLVQAGIACAATIYGSVANEMAYFGVPTIACARHPHSSFDFCVTAGSREEYAAFLRGYAEIRMDKSTMRRQSLIFYYMCNFGGGEENTALTDAVMDFRLACAEADEADVVDRLTRVAAMPAYASYISKWQDCVFPGDIPSLSAEAGGVGYPRAQNPRSPMCNSRR